MSKRLNSNDWLKIGLTLLTRSETKTLGIDNLCAAAGKTRGSFYHHFVSMDEFVTRMLKLWEKDNTTRLIKATEGTHKAHKTREALNHLARLASDLDLKCELAIRRLATGNSGAKKACARIDKVRTNHLAKLYATSHFSKKEAQTLARVEYAAWVGLQTINPDIKAAQITRLYADFLSLTKDQSRDY